jgi:2-polyprenyl-6-methoxyphenol hydroxylase-like FAD-dependent oxidoreductase
MLKTMETRCCIVGGGPAGMMLAYLLGRAGVPVLLLEKHGDFLRDFRGDTVHPSTMRILDELGLLEDFLRLPHTQISALSAEVDDEPFKLAEFGSLTPPGNFIALMPQWDFLNFLADKSRRFPTLEIRMSTAVSDIVERDNRVVGVRAISPQGPIEIRADLVIGCDGRSSTVRDLGGLVAEDMGAPIDVLWFRLSRKPGDPGKVLGHLGKDRMLVTIDRGDYWQ